MGTFTLPITISDQQLVTSEQVEALVDTGATNTVLPPSFFSVSAYSPTVNQPSSWPTAAN